MSERIQSCVHGKTQLLVDFNIDEYLADLDARLDSIATELRRANELKRFELKIHANTNAERGLIDLAWNRVEEERG